MNALKDVTDLSASIRSKANKNQAPDKLELDPYYEPDPEAYRIAKYALTNHKNLLLMGDTGCGKSTLIVYTAIKLGLGLEIANLQGETSTEEIMIKPWRQPNGELVTVDGPAVRAYRTGVPFLAEEWNTAQPDILTALNRIMEVNQKHITLYAGEKEVVQRHPNFCMIATCNDVGTGENAFMYAGGKIQNAATLNRWSLTIKLGYMKPDKEIRVLVNKTGVEKTLATRMVEVANDARPLLKSQTNRMTTAVSTRDLLEWGDLMVNLDLSPLDSADYTFLNRANELDSATIRTFIENRLG